MRLIRRTRKCSKGGMRRKRKRSTNPSIFYHPDVHHCKTKEYLDRSQRLLNKALKGEIFLMLESVLFKDATSFPKLSILFNESIVSDFIWGIESPRTINNYLALLLLLYSNSKHQNTSIDQLSNGYTIMELLISIQAINSFHYAKYEDEKWYKEIVIISTFIGDDDIKDTNYCFKKINDTALRKFNGIPRGVPVEFINYVLEENLTPILNRTGKTEKEFLNYTLYTERERNWVKNINFINSKYNEKNLDVHYIVGSGHLFPMRSPNVDFLKIGPLLEQEYQKIEGPRLTELLPGKIFDFDLKSCHNVEQILLRLPIEI